MIFKKFILAGFIFVLLLSGCAKGDSGETTSNKTGVSGLTSIEASKIAYDKVKNVFEKPFIYRAIPVSKEKSTNLLLDSKWYENDIAGGWAFWFANTEGANWMIVLIEGKKVVDTNFETFEFNPVSFPTDWPSSSLQVSMKEAAVEANRQGANLSTLTWIEYNCDYKASDYRKKPLWALSFSEEVGSSTLNYTIFVNGISGKALGAIFINGDRLELPIDREKLQKPRAENHQQDIIEFFKFISNKEYDFALFQLAYDLCPNDASRAMWLENFKSINSVEVVSITPHRLPEWNEEREYYKVVLNIQTDASPEQFGWEKGENTRWITIIPEGAGYWKIEEMSTSP